VYYSSSLRKGEGKGHRITRNWRQSEDVQEKLYSLQPRL